jgi:MATE family multidrug resistance protein
MSTLRRELVGVARLSAPVVLVQLGLMTVGVVDTLMLGRVGVTELAASALANSWQWVSLSLGLGLVMGIEPLISQAHGAGDGDAAALALQRGLVVALLAGLPVALAMAGTRQGLLLLGQDPIVAELAGRYNLYKLPTAPGFLVYSALRQYLQARTLMAPATWVMWIGNGLHVVLDWALIFGHLGAPALGIDGAAISSAITVVFLPLGLAAWVRAFRLHEGAWRRWDRQVISWVGLRQVLRLGGPVGATLSLEASAFSLGTWMAGWLGRDELASHQIVLNMAALSFMVPLGISQGGAVRVGNLIGRGDAAGMRRAIQAALLLGVGVMAVSAALMSLLRFELPALYTGDARVVALAAQILPLAAAFQLWDGTQVVAGGVLRGMGRPGTAALVNLVGYYAVALPLAYVLAFGFQMGLSGIWVALAAGLAVVALSLAFWVRRTARQPLAELSLQAAR